MGKTTSAHVVTTPCIDDLGHNIYIGNFAAGRDLDILQKHGITHIVNATLEGRSTLPGIEVLRVAVQDTTGEALRPHLRKVMRFIRAAVTSGRVLVHCYRGTSRSVSLVLAYLVSVHRMTLEQALTYVREHRPSTSPPSYPNKGFVKELQEWEADCFLSLNLDQPPSHPAVDAVETVFNYVRNQPPERIPNLDAMYQLLVTVNGTFAGAWLADLSVNPPEFRRAVDPAAHFRVTLEGQDLVALASGELDPMDAYEQRKFEWKGDLTVLNRLQNLQEVLKEARDLVRS